MSERHWSIHSSHIFDCFYLVQQFQFLCLIYGICNVKINHYLCSKIHIELLMFALWFSLFFSLLIRVLCIRVHIIFKYLSMFMSAEMKAAWLNWIELIMHEGKHGKTKSIRKPFWKWIKNVQIYLNSYVIYSLHIFCSSSFRCSCCRNNIKCNRSNANALFFFLLIYLETLQCQNLFLRCKRRAKDYE